MIIATTKLDAINIILSSIGAAPVNTINAEIDADVANACAMLDKTSRDIQRKGWDFNTEHMTLSPDLYTGRIGWIPSIISFQSADGGTYAKRGEHFYDMSERSFVFARDISIDAVLALDFEDLPDCFKNYIAARAAVDFQAHFMGDANLSQTLMASVQEAYQDLLAYDMGMQPLNMLQIIGVTPVLERS